MRILKFIGVFLATLIIVLILTFGFSFDTLVQLFENRDGIQEGQEWVAKTFSLKGLTEYIGAQPERVSLASLNVKNPDSSLLYNEHTPRTMGTLSRVFLITEYVRQVEQQKISPRTPVSLDKLEIYQLPYINASNHSNALSALNDRNQISDNRMIAMDNLVRIAIEFNDIAATDYLLVSLGPTAIEQLMDKLEMKETESVLPFFGLYIILNPHLYDETFDDRMNSLSQLSRVEFEELVWETAYRYIEDERFQQRVRNLFDEKNGLGIKFTEARNALDFFPKTTAAEMSDLMIQIQQETLISRQVSKEIKDLMDWPLDTEELKKQLKAYGAMYDSRMGMANVIDFGVSARTGKSFAQAVFFDDLQVAFWFHMSSGLIHQDYGQRLIWDPALRNATENQIRRN